MELIRPRQDCIALLNRQNSKGTTALWIASCNRHIEIVSNLLDFGADPNIENNKGENSIIPCCQKGAVNIADLLIASGAKIDLFNKNRDNSLLICCRNGQKDILQLLLEQCKKHNKLTMLEDCAEIDGFNPLIASAESDKVECIKLCVKYGANIEFKTNDNNQILAGATALHIACLYNKISSVKTLYEIGADLKSQTSQGYTCMHIAVKQGHKHLVKYLLSLKVGKQLLEIVDNNNKIPKYYCNDSMLDEFFTNKICNYLYNLLFCDNVLIKKCVDIMLNYGKSVGVFGYKDFIDLLIGNGNTLYSYALITKNEFLIDQVKKLNPSLNITDDTAINSRFWEGYTAYCDTNNLDLDVANKIAQVNKVSQLNSQNRFLTSLNKMPLLCNKEVKLRITDKMNDGYDNIVTDTSINTIIAQSNKDIMLIGFLEKLKNSKNFTDGVQCLEYILWKAKIHILKMIANGEKLQPINLLALYLISTNDNIFRQVNLSLINWSRTNIWNPFCVCLYQSLQHLPNHVGEIYRAVDTKFSINDYKIDSYIVWNTFSTCSNESKPVIDYLSQNKGIVFIINSLTCKNISSYSTRPGDCGMMFLPGTRFVIKAYYKPSMIAICQKNIRTSTFKIADKDIEKATKGVASIIVEIDE
ncbi:ankyrin repeat domain-containing protein, partial [bacterium]